ncbi:selenide, water dikinase SelD [soil metagenome]
MAHGGGCGCKIAPAILRDILSRTPAARPFESLLVGTETSDDAAVWRLNETQALVATTDFFMPMIDDPFDFGRIAATNALSDIYAMGGSPIFALAVVGMPIKALSVETIGRVLEGGAAVCASAGIPIAGGHSIDSLEPIYGLVAIGLVHPDRVMTNRTARAGDVLILTKGLGVGILGAAFKKGMLEPAGYAALIASTTQLNAVGAELAGDDDVHAMTDVTGFGLLGHALELAKGSGLRLTLDAASLPWLTDVEALAGRGVVSGASGRNWASYGAEIDAPGLDGALRDLLCDPQTSGGLLLSVAPERSAGVLELLHARGFDRAARIGEVGEGRAGVCVRLTA